MSSRHPRPRHAATLLLAAALAAVIPAAPALAGGDWNDGQVAWRAYDEGLAAAREQGKPICLIFFTEWCPHCTNYSGVFHDPAVVERSKEFVMVRLDRDRNRELSKKFAPDGEYIPRTYFLSPQGVLDPALKAPRDRFQYFYDEHDPASLLDGMKRALAKLR
jgi:Thioredoxin-like